jgi:methyl-accepting chemotaxis protein
MKNIRIGVRLAASFAAVVGLFLVTLLVIGVSLDSVTKNIRQIKEVSLPYTLIIDQMDTSRSEVQQFLTDVSATHNREGYKDADISAQRFLVGVEKFKQELRKEGRLDRLKEMEEIESDFNRFYDMGKKMAEIYVTKGMEAGNVVMESFDEESLAVSRSLEKFRGLQVDGANDMASNTLDSADNASKLMFLSGMVATLLAVALSVLITRSVTLPINRLSFAILAVSKNLDFTNRIPVDGRDETSQSAGAFNELITTLQASFGQIRGSISEIHDASATLLSISQQVASSSEQQSAAASSIAATVEQVTASISHVADSANDALKVSRESGELSSRGGETIHNAAAEMEIIADTVRQTSTFIEELDQKSMQISSIARVIKEIADQTNLLALNAAIEAARAGEQGRGFAVVADEVRKLAERTGAATNEISEMIGSIQSTTQIAVSGMSDAVILVDKGAALAKQAGVSIDQIKIKSDQAIVTAGEISSALAEQSKASNDIAMNIEKIAQMSQKNSADIQNSSAATGNLAQLATKMREMVNRFGI